MAPSSLATICGPVALAVAVGGCSLAFVNGPPAGHEKLPYFDCTTSNLLPTGDLVYAGINVVDAVADLGGAAAFSGNKPISALFAAEAVAFGASALYGYGKTSQCRKAQVDMIQRSSRTPVSPSGFAPYTPGFAPPPPVPYDPWVAPPPPSSGPPPALSPVGPLPPVPAPARDDETPTGEKPVQ